MVNHLTGHPKGGFVGVDVFFVISGYLITGHLVREHLRHGKISLIGFYKRRIRRLLPSALTVTVLTVLAAHLLFARARFKAVGLDAIWATLFAANWRLIRTGTDYFASSDAVSPFQHYWSLSVEEQFYLAWPLLLLAALGLAAKVRFGRTNSSRAGVVLMLAAMISAASLMVAVSQSDSSPVRAYFSTFTRVWELGLGALLAVAVPRIRLTAHSALVLSSAGVLAVFVSFFTTSSSHGFPAPAALLPCLGAAGIIFAGATHAAPNNRLLNNRAATYVGDISYSVYVCHFPLIIFMGVLVTGHQSACYYIATVAAIAGCSIALFHLVEDPIRRSSWLTRKSEGLDRRTPNAADSPRPQVKHVLIPAGAFLALAVWTVNFAPLAEDDAAGFSPVPLGSTAATAPAIPRDEPRLAALQVQINDALRTFTWPKLSPSLDSIIGGPKAPAEMSRCASPDLPNPASCTFGSPSATRTVYLVGDSTSMAYAEAFKQIALMGGGWKVRVASAYGCAFDSVPLKNADEDVARQCPAHNAAAVAEIRSTRPDLVIVTNRYSGAKTATATNNELTNEQWTDALADQIRQVQPSAGKVLVLTPPPADKDISACYTPSSAPAACVSGVLGSWQNLASAEQHMAAALRIGFLDSRLWYCNTGGACPSFVGTVPVKVDLVHITPAYADLVAPVMLESLKRSGYLRAT